MCLAFFHIQVSRGVFSPPTTDMQKPHPHMEQGQNYVLDEQCLVTAVKEYSE